MVRNSLNKGSEKDGKSKQKQKEKKNNNKVCTNQTISGNGKGKRCQISPPESWNEPDNRTPGKKKHTQDTDVRPFVTRDPFHLKEKSGARAIGGGGKTKYHS